MLVYVSSLSLYILILSSKPLILYDVPVAYIGSICNEAQVSRLSIYATVIDVGTIYQL